MTVDAESPVYIEYVSVGGTDYAVPFTFETAADLDIYLDGVLTASGFTVTGGDGSTGTVVFSPAPDADVVVGIWRDTSPAQGLSAASEPDDSDFESALDRLTRLIQEARRDTARNAARTIRLADTDDAADLTLPLKAARESKIITFDEDGNLVVGAIDDLIDDELASTIWRQGAEVSGGAVESVFGRTGAVVAASGDYDADEITETASRVFLSPAQKTKLDGIETAATADQTGAEIGTLLDTLLGHTGWRVNATNIVLTTATAPASYGFVSTNSDLSVDGSKLATRTAVASAIAAAVGAGAPVSAVDVSSGATLVTGRISILTTATDTQTASLAAATGDAQWHKIHNSVAFAQTIAPTSGGDDIAGIPGESTVTSFALAPGATVELARPAGGTTWYIVGYVPAFDAVSGALVTDTAAPEHDAGTISSSPWAPALSDGLVQVVASGINFTLGTPTGDVPAGTRPRMDIFVTATADILVTLDGGYTVDGDNLPLFAETDDILLIQFEYDGSAWHAIGPLSVPVTTVVDSAPTLEPWSQTVYLTGTAACVLPDTRLLKRTTTIRVIRNGASGDRTMTKEYASDAFVGSDTLASAANMIAFTAEPSASGGNWYSTTV